MKLRAHALAARRLFAAALAATCLWRARPADAEMLPIRTFTRADGLPHDRVKRIVPDRRGFLWFCTTEGLARFDGRLFVVYGAHEGLPVPSINDLLESPDGFWVATNGGGLALFDPYDISARFRTVRVGDGAANRVNVLARDERGTIWAGTDGGLFRVARAGNGLRAEAFPLAIPGYQDASVQVTALLPLEGGRLLAGTRHGLVLLGERAPRLIRLGPGEDDVLALARAPGGEILLGLRGTGLAWLDPSLAVTGRIGRRDGLPDASACALLASRDRWVIGTFDGIAVVRSGRVAATYGLASGLPERQITALAEDREGNVWVGTPGWGGASMVDLRGSVLFGEADGVGRMVNAVWRRASGELWAAGSGWTISRFDGRAFHAVHPRLPARVAPDSWRAYYATREDREHMLWMATGDGVYRFGPVRDLDELPRLEPNLHLSAAGGLPEGDVSRLFLDSRGDLWVGTFASVQEPLAVWHRDTGRIERFGSAQGLPAVGSVAAFCEDSSGELWVAFRDGVVVRRRAGAFETIGAVHGFPAAPVTAMTCDSAGRLWASTAGAGLVLVEDPGARVPRARVFGRREGIRDFYLGHLLAVSGGRLLVATARQFLLFDPASRAVTETQAARASFPAEPVAALEDADGTLWFGSMRGLARSVPAAPGPRRGLRVRISGVVVSGTARPLPGDGTEDHEIGGIPSDANVSFSFFGLGLYGEPVLFEHLMEGLDRAWSAGHAENVVHYGRLAPGSYRFRVRATAGRDSAPGEAVVSFTVPPPLWQRPWFVGVLALALAGLGYATAQAQARRKRALEEVRSRIASDLHDDLGASLSRISILSEVAARTVREGRPPHEIVGTIGEASRTVVEKLADGIWAVDPRRDDLASLVVRLQQAAHELLEPAGAAWRVEVPAGAERLRLHPERRRHVYLLLKEAIVNAARHSGARHVVLTVSRERHRIRFTLEDDGRGVEPAAAHRAEPYVGGRGLANMRRRAEALRGTLEIAAAPGAGTRVRLDIPER